MKYIQRLNPKKSLILLASLSGLAFSNPKFVELENVLNGRSSAHFTQAYGNISSQLPKGTRGEVLSTKRFKTGNYGIKIVVVNGDKKGETFWVYHNPEKSNLKLYNSQPTNWGNADKGLETKNAETATHALTTAPVTSVADAPGTRDLSNDYGNSPDADEQPKNKTTDSENDRAEAVRETLSLIAKANEANRKQPCIDCDVATTGTNKKSSSEVVSEERETAKPQQEVASTKPSISYSQNNLSIDSRCSAIMSKNGTFGNLGKSMADILAQPKYSAAFTKSNALGKLCPKFNNLSQDQKLHAWVFMWGVLAFEESNCNHNVIHQTHTSSGRRINPRVGKGLWAAESSASIRRGRGAACNDINSALGQAKCAIDTMFKAQLNRGHTATGAPTNNIYWGPIRRADSQLTPKMRSYKGCF